MNIICISIHSQKNIVININDKFCDQYDKTDDYCIGYNKNEICFINIFNSKFCNEYELGLIYPDEKFFKKLNKFFNIKLNTNVELPKLLVVKIVDLQPVPNTHLNYCDVLVNNKNSILKIVCGASNARKNLVTVAALDNTLIPNGTLIKKGKIMNLESNGMLCSSKELNIISNTKGIIELDEKKYKVGNIFKNVYVNLK